MKVKIPKLIKMLYPRRIWDGGREAKIIYLTFDDGPIHEVTPWVLQQLKKYDAKASFFCIGDNLAAHPDIFKRLIAEGHSVGNHTYNHLNGWKTSTKDYLQNTSKAQQLMQEYAPQRALKNAFFRPPYGKIRNRQAKKLCRQGYKIVMWDIVSEDYNREITPEKCLQNVLKYTVPGSLIVFHDSLKAERNMKYALPRVLEHYSQRGYSFRSLDELV
ncbi:MAG: polysaccharide deacetylase family protein [Salinimicrobium sp.]